MNLKHLLVAVLACASGLPLLAAESFKWDNINVEFLPAKVPGRIKNHGNQITEVNSVLGEHSVTIFHLKKKLPLLPINRVSILPTMEKLFLADLTTAITAS